MARKQFLALVIALGGFAAQALVPAAASADCDLLCNLGSGLENVTTGLSDALNPNQQVPANDADQPLLTGVTQTVQGITQPVNQTLAPVTDTLNQTLAPVTQTLAPVTQALEPVLAPVTQALAPIVEAVAPALAPATKAVGEVLAPVMDVIEPVLAPITEALAPVIEPVIDTVSPVLEPVLGAVSPILEPVVDAVTPVLEPVIEVVTPITDPVVDVLEPVLDPIEDVLPPVVGPIVDPVTPDPIDNNPPVNNPNNPGPIDGNPPGGNNPPGSNPGNPGTGPITPGTPAVPGAVITSNNAGATPPVFSPSTAEDMARAGNLDGLLGPAGSLGLTSLLTAAGEAYAATGGAAMTAMSTAITTGEAPEASGTFAAPSSPRAPVDSAATHPAAAAASAASGSSNNNSPRFDWPAANLPAGLLGLFAVGALLLLAVTEASPRTWQSRPYTPPA